MIFRTQVRDCLYLNWALPVAAMPPPPEPLRYDTQRLGEEAMVFLSALLFRQDGLQTDGVPLPRVDAPQFQLHLCTLDEDGVPSVFIQSVLVPTWLAPGARWITRQPARSARLLFPDALEGESAWHWEVRRGDRLVVDAELGTPPPGVGPDLGSWEETVAYFRRRGLGFTESLRGLRRVEIERGRRPVTPVRAVIAQDRLLMRVLADAHLEAMPELHSAWIGAPMTISYELSGAEHSTVGSEVPAPG